MSNFAFIDSQNVNLAVRLEGWRIDWPRFRIYLRDKYKVSKAFLFIGYVDGNNALYVSLQEAGFICIFKPTLRYRDGKIKGNVDAELVLHAMIHFSEYDKAVIITGDGDFYCLISYLLERRKLRIVLVPNRYKYSALLKQFAKGNIDFMNNLSKKIGQK